MSEKLVLIHGWGFNRSVWQPVIEQLRDHYEVYALNLPGYGGREDIPDAGLPAITESLLQEAPEQAIWLGWSLGGQIAWQAAMDAPERVKAIIAVAANPKFVASAEWPGVAREVLRTFADELADDHLATLKRFIFLQQRGQGGKAVLQNLTRQLTDSPVPKPETLRRGLAILEDTDQREHLASIQCPVSLIHGDRDTLVPATVPSRIQAQCPDWQTSRIEGAGHAPFLFDPDQFVQTVTRFVNAHV